MTKTTEEDKKLQHELLKYSIQQFDKNVIYIASGALIISFAFLKEIITDISCAEHKNWLITSWMIFAIVIFISLLAHWISSLAQAWDIKNENLEYDAYIKKARWWNWSLRIMNLSTIIGILAGALYLLYFIKTNL